MSLRFRIGGGLVLLTAVAILGPGLWQWRQLSRRIDAMERRESRELASALQARWNGVTWLLGRKVAEQAGAIAADPALATSLALGEDAAHGRSGLLGRGGLDLLWLLDDEGRVLAAPHWPALEGQVDLGLLGGKPGRPTLVERPVRNERWLAVVLAEPVALPGRTLRLVGGIHLARAVREQMAPDDALGLALYDPGGDLLAARPWPVPVQGLASGVAASGGGGLEAAMPGEAGGRYRVAGKALAGEGRLLATLVAWRPLEEIEAWRVGLAASSVGTGVAAVLLAAVLGVWLARRIARPVGDLTDAAGRLAAGELDLRLAVRGDDEVGRLTAAFNAMATAIRRGRRELAASERLAAWRDAARRMAHEVKNPLAPIRMSVENLRRARQASPGTFERHFEVECRTIIEEVDALRRLVDEFSRFARLPSPEMQPTAPGSLVERVAGLFAGRDDGVRIEHEVEANLPAVNVDADLMAQVLKNLVVNALAVVPRSGGWIRLSCRRDGAGISFEVVDNGPGIPENLRDRLFEPHVSGNPAGSGLGLAISKQIVDSHGGRIEAAETGSGAIFRVLLSGG